MGTDDAVASDSKAAPHLSEEEVRILRAMTPAQKIAVMHSLIRQAYDLKAAGIRARWPELPEEEVRARTRALVGGALPGVTSPIPE